MYSLRGQGTAWEASQAVHKPGRLRSTNYLLLSHSRHFMSFQRWWGDCSISRDCSCSQRWG